MMLSTLLIVWSMTWLYILKVPLDEAGIILVPLMIVLAIKDSIIGVNNDQ